MRAPVVTASWRALWEASRAGTLDVAPVRISLGRPKFWPQEFLFLPDLAPDGWMRPLHGEQFRDAYVAKLDRIGVDPIYGQLVVARDACRAETIALCCFEPSYRDCHRGLLAAWWLHRTGELWEEIGQEVQR
jgi:hypothetical protein